MQVIVKDRREGKTTELVKWLCEGKMQDGYPQWSRVIVAPNATMVVTTSRMVRGFLQRSYAPSDICRMSKPHMTEDCEVAHKHTEAQIVKAVWGIYDLQRNSVGGSRSFEFAIDDLDEFIRSKFNGRLPTVVTMTGELYHG